MTDVAEIQSLFSGLGAGFLASGEEIRSRLAAVQAFVFDWDGVFNTGAKGEGSPGTFSEPDSMGTNLLRYAYWRIHNRLPVCAIVSGASNATAIEFARREHLHCVHCGVRDKAQAFDAISETYALARNEMAYVFDDANDLSVADGCGLRLLVRRDASPLLREYAAENGLIDYVTAAAAGQYPVREISELLIGLLGQDAEVFASRQRYDTEYQQYFAARQSTETSVFDAA